MKRCPAAGVLIKEGVYQPMHYHHSGFFPKSSISRKRRAAALLWAVLLAVLLIHEAMTGAGLRLDQRLFSTRSTIQIPVSAESSADDSAGTDSTGSTDSIAGSVITGRGQDVSSVSIRVKIPDESGITPDSQIELKIFSSDGTLLTDSYTSVLPDSGNAQASDSLSGTDTEPTYHTDNIILIPLSPAPVHLENGATYQIVLSVTEGTVNVLATPGTSDILMVCHGDALAEEQYLRHLCTAIILLLAVPGLILLITILTGSLRADLLALAGFILNAVTVQYVCDHILENSRGTWTAFFLLAVLTAVSAGAALRNPWKARVQSSTYPLHTSGRPEQSLSRAHRSRNALLLQQALLFAAALSFLLIIPLGQVPDEQLHFYRAYEISCGSFVSKQLGDKSVGDILPTALSSYEDSTAVIDWNNTSAFEFPNTAQYSPVGYLPQVIGIRIARLFTNRTAALFLAGRIGNFVCCFVLSALALWLMPYGREWLFLIMMFPMTLQEMVSMSVDGGANATVFLYIALILHLREKFRTGGISGTAASGKSGKTGRAKALSPLPWSAAVLTLLGTVIALEKMVYVVVVLLVFLLPGMRLSSVRKNKSTSVKFHEIMHILARLAVTILIPAAAVVLWERAVSGLSGETYLGVNSAAQLRYILEDPVRFVWVMLRTFSQYFDEWSSELIGSYMGWLEISVSALSWLPLLLLLVLYAVSPDNEMPSFRRRERCILLLPVLAGIVLINTGMYLNWTAAGFLRVEGIQARYFQPLLPAAMLWILSERKALAAESSRRSIPQNVRSTPVHSRPLQNIAPVIILFSDIIAITDFCCSYLT